MSIACFVLYKNWQAALKRNQVISEARLKEMQSSTTALIESTNAITALAAKIDDNTTLVKDALRNNN
jgi:hypothetical protein